MFRMRRNFVFVFAFFFRTQTACCMYEAALPHLPLPVNCVHYDSSASLISYWRASQLARFHAFFYCRAEQRAEHMQDKFGGTKQKAVDQSPMGRVKRVLSQAGETKKKRPSSQEKGTQNGGFVGRFNLCFPHAQPACKCLSSAFHE